MAETTLEPASGAERFVLHLRAHPGLKADRFAVAKVLGISATVVDAVLLPAVDLGLVTVAADPDLGRCWRAGPRLDNWRPAGAPITATPAAQPAKATRGGRRNILPPLQVSKLHVAKDKPLPFASVESKGRTRHDAVFDQLRADGMSVTGIPVAYRGALAKAVQTYVEQRPALKAASHFTVRVVDGETCGIWRLARDKAATLPGPGRKTQAAIAA